MKKVALVIYSLNMGGAEKVVADLSCFFNEEYEVFVIVFDDSLRYYTCCGTLVDLKLPSRTGFFAKVLNLWKRTQALRQLFKNQQFDYVFSFMEHANFPTILASKNCIVSNHCNPETFSRLEWLFVKWLYPKARKVIAVSRQGMEKFRRQAGLANIGCLYNPVNIKFLVQKAAEKPPIVIESEFIIAVGRLSAEKNFAHLIRAYAQSGLQQHYQLLILGEGVERAALETLCQALQIQDRVLLPGFIQAPYALMARAKFLVLSSLHEGFPVVLLEALALQTPVIATDCETGPNEIIRQEHNGLLVPVADEQALAQAMRRLTEDAGLYRHLRQQARDSVQRFDLFHIGPQWIDQWSA